MKLNKSLLIVLVLLVVVGSVFRVAGFAPQIAMAIFGAAVIKDKRLAFGLPILSMLISDAVYQSLYLAGYLNFPGFYKGLNFYDSQLLNYLLLASLTMFGFWARNLNMGRIIGATLGAPVFYFLVSNFLVWIGGSGFYRPQTFEGLILCYEDGLPFLRSSLQYTAMFSAIFFGSFFMFRYFTLQREKQSA